MNQVTFKGKLYGYATQPSGQIEIRSETNPAKTPWLKRGSATYTKVLAAILAAKAA